MTTYTQLKRIKQLPIDNHPITYQPRWGEFTGGVHSTILLHLIMEECEKAEKVGDEVAEFGLDLLQKRAGLSIYQVWIALSKIGYKERKRKYRNTLKKEDAVVIYYTANRTGQKEDLTNYWRINKEVLNKKLRELEEGLTS